MDQQYIEGSAVGEGQKSNRTLIIILIIVAVLLCCCCIAVAVTLITGLGAGGWINDYMALLPRFA